MNQGSPIPNPIRTPVRQNVYPAVGNVEMNKRIGIFDFFQKSSPPLNILMLYVMYRSNFSNMGSIA